MPAQKDFTDLMNAVIKNKPADVLSLLKKKNDPNAVADLGTTALMWGCIYNSFEAVEALLKNAKNLDIDKVRKADGASALSIAAQNKDGEKLTSLLLKHKAKQNISDKSNKTPLIYATENKKNGLAIMKVLLDDKTVKPIEQIDNIKKALKVAQKNSNPQMQSLLKEKLQQLEEREKKILERGGINNPLTEALIKNHPRSVSILAKSYDPNTQMELGTTALMIGCSEGSVAAVETLLKKSKTVNVNQVREGKGGDTALIVAAGNKKVGKELTTLLLKHGADQLIEDEKGETALMHAARNKNGLEIVRTLLDDKNVDPEKQKKNIQKTLEKLKNYEQEANPEDYKEVKRAVEKLLEKSLEAKKLNQTERPPTSIQGPRFTTRLVTQTQTKTPTR